MPTDLQYTLYIVLAPLAALSAAMVLYYAWVNRDPTTQIVRTLSWLIIVLIGWLTFNTLELMAPTPRLTLFFAGIAYFFIIASPVVWLAFCLHYTGHQRWLRWRHFGWLLIVPTINLLAIWTNSWHNLHWRAYEFLPKGSLLAMFVTEYGPFFWVMVINSYILIAAGVIFIGRRHFTTAAIYRGQSRWVLFGAMLPVLSNLIYIFRLVPGLTKDYTGISFAAASIAFALGISRHDLFRLSPVARELVVDKMTDPMLVVDATQRIADLNPAAQRLLWVEGSRRPIQVGGYLSELSRPWLDLVERVKSGETGESGPDLEVEEDGAIHTFDVRIIPIQDVDEVVSGHLIVLRDITDRKQAETMLRNYTRELEARNKELDAFASTVAHDLKTPLVGLVGFSQALTDLGAELSHNEAQDLLQEINRSGMRMSNIVDALLLLASVRRRDQVPLKALEMGVIADEVIARLTPQIQESGAVVAIQPGAWPQVMGYAPWIEEIWVNYLSNALKYGLSPGAVPSRILLGWDLPSQSAAAGASGQPSAPGMGRFWVQDWGGGIPKDKQATLFVEFTRLSHSDTKGHGLGLSIVHRIAQRLDGDAGVESQEGEGSTFWFTLPLA